MNYQYLKSKKERKKIQIVNILSSIILAISTNENIMKLLAFNTGYQWFIPKICMAYIVYSIWLFGLLLMVSWLIWPILYDFYGLYLMAYMISFQWFMTCF